MHTGLEDHNEMATTSKTLEAQQDRALIALLLALPDHRRELVLAGVGVQPEQQPTKRRDDLCDICGLGYLRCRAADKTGDHEFTRKARDDRAQ